MLSGHHIWVLEVCCTVLQCVLHRVALCRCALQSFHRAVISRCVHSCVYCSALHFVAVCGAVCGVQCVLQCVWQCVLQCVAAMSSNYYIRVWRKGSSQKGINANTQNAATRCNTLQHTATRCNTPKDKTDDKILSTKHYKASLYRTTAACHCSMSLQHAPATRTPLLQHAHFYSNVSLQHAYHHCSTHSISAACAPTCTPSQHRLTVTLQYNAQKWYTRVLQRVGIYHTASMIVYIMLQCNEHSVRAIVSDDLL